MIENLKPYPEYKDSGLPWLGEVPAHWELKRLGSVFEERGESNEKRGVTDILSVLKDRGVIPYSEKGRIGNKASDDIGRYKIVRPDDLVLNSMNVIIGSLGISRYTGCLSPVYYVLSQREQANNVRYLALFFQNKQFHESLIRIGNGILAHRMRIPMEKLKAELITLPPPEEQAAIARFLAWATNRLDHAIGAKRRIIALLQEQKQAIIHRAVTRGLDPSVPLKDSGIPWLGEIPEHWEVTRVKGEFECLNFRRIPLSTTERGKMKRRQYDYYGASGIIDKVEEHLFDEDLILIAEDGANLVNRNLPLAIVARGKYWVNNHAHILRPRKGQLEYLAALLESMDFRPWISGAAQPKLTQDRLMGIRIAIPPPEEQAQIVEAFNKEAEPITLSIQELLQEASLLREYRTRLIADVVTGKLDVREVAAWLPEDVEPSIQSDAASYDGDDAEDDPGSDPIDTEED
jgi:type I restriction enzyme S subunit